MTETTEIRRRRLKFRSWHRGTKEMDLLLGGFADAYLDGYDTAELDLYEALLIESDPDLYNWIAEREPVPAAQDSAVLRAIIAYNNRPKEQR